MHQDIHESVPQDLIWGIVLQQWHKHLPMTKFYQIKRTFFINVNIDTSMQNFHGRNLYRHFCISAHEFLVYWKKRQCVICRLYIYVCRYAYRTHPLSRYWQKKLGLFFSRRLAQKRRRNKVKWTRKPEGNGKRRKKGCTDNMGNDMCDRVCADGSVKRNNMSVGGCEIGEKKKNIWEKTWKG